jgi:hypothetical protein
MNAARCGLCSSCTVPLPVAGFSFPAAGYFDQELKR